MKNNKKPTKTNPLQSITEHPEQRKHESREKMGRNDKETEPMNPLKNNQANPEIEAKKEAKAYLIEQPTEAENPRKETTKRRLRPTQNQAITTIDARPRDLSKQTAVLSLGENMRPSRQIN